MTITPAMAAWVVIPFGPRSALANVNAGLLLLMAITSMEVYGVIIAGWASNSKYAFLGAMRASAQMVSYEIAIGFALVVVLMVSGSLNMTDIVLGQGQGYFAQRGIKFLSWNWLPLLPIFVVYVISAVAETNRHPFDVVEGESEIVAGHMVEYSGMGFAVFFLAEYANMILLSAVASIMFLGGWYSPLDFAAVQLDSGLDLARHQDFLRGLAVHLVPGIVPALPLRPDHAPGLEDLHPGDAGLAGGRGDLDADAVEHLEVTTASRRRRYRTWKRSGISSRVSCCCEMLKGLMLTGGTSSRARSRSSTRKRRRRCRRAFAACTRCAATRTARSAASPASCARRCARRWRSPSSRSSATTARAAPPATTST